MASIPAAEDQSTQSREYTETELPAIEVSELLASLGKKVIRMGGRPATEQLLEMARFEPGQQVLDASCGVGSTAIEIAGRFDCEVTAIDVSPSMVEQTATNVRAANLQDKV